MPSRPYTSLLDLLSAILDISLQLALFEQADLMSAMYFPYCIYTPILRYIGIYIVVNTHLYYQLYHFLPLFYNSFSSLY